MRSRRKRRCKSKEIFNKPGARHTLTGYLHKCLPLVLMAFLVTGLWAAQSTAYELCLETGDCLACHPNTQNPENDNWKPIHKDSEHPVTITSGPVVFFPDRSHDDAAWAYGQPSPHFAVDVVCATCHTNDLRPIHGQDCFACHTTNYYASVEGNWQGGCQQGACHQSYHEDSSIAHLEWEDATNGSQDCNVCHEASTWNVPSSNCLECHATYGGNDNTPPVTSTDALAEYIGPARIKFKITESGKVGVGRTFYKLDSGKETGGMEVYVPNSNPGEHTLEYFSVDQAGNIELLHKWAEFTVIADTEAPVTTSNAQSTYNTQYAVINLSATDNSTLGVKNTYYRLDGGPTKTGTRIVASGGGTHTLEYWSVDWAGITEDHNNVQFTILSPGIIRLVWWDADVNPNHGPSGDDAASWTVRRGSWSGPVVATGSGSAPGWDGVDDISVQVGYAYFVRIDWYCCDGEDDQTDFANVLVTSPGQVVKLNY